MKHRPPSPAVWEVLQGKAGLVPGHCSSEPTTAAQTTGAFRSQGVHQAGECSSSGKHHNLWAECLVRGKNVLNHPSTDCQTSWVRVCSLLINPFPWPWKLKVGVSCLAMHLCAYKVNMWLCKRCWRNFYTTFWNSQSQFQFLFCYIFLFSCFAFFSLLSFFFFFSFAFPFFFKFLAYILFFSNNKCTFL